MRHIRVDIHPAIPTSLFVASGGYIPQPGLPNWLNVALGLCLVMWWISRVAPDVWEELQQVAKSWLRLLRRPPPT